MDAAAAPDILSVCLEEKWRSPPIGWERILLSRVRCDGFRIGRYFADGSSRGVAAILRMAA
jgi:hypothetical protein